MATSSRRGKTHTSSTTKNAEQPSAAPQPSRDMPREIPPGLDYVGRTIQERMWDPIDEKMDLLMDPNKWSSNEEREGIAGFLRGAADMMAMFLNPSRPDVREVKRIAMQRWRYRHYESESWF
jgi:hypothetical protein